MCKDLGMSAEGTATCAIGDTKGFVPQQHAKQYCNVWKLAVKRQTLLKVVRDVNTGIAIQTCFCVQKSMGLPTASACIYSKYAWVP